MNRLKKYVRLIVVALISLTLVCTGVFNSRNSSAADGYWLWGGKTFQDIPASKLVYVFQGTISTIDGEPDFLHQGVYPHPVSNKLVLVFRFETLDHSRQLIDLMQNIAWQWESHGVSVLGIQLDYDSPSSKLLSYSNVLYEIRQKLERRYFLSVTGLGDWLFSADKKALYSLFDSVDEVVFQLYRGYHYEPLDDYLKALHQLPFKFKLGLLKDHQDNERIMGLISNLNELKGLVYFII